MKKELDSNELKDVVGGLNPEQYKHYQDLMNEGKKDEAAIYLGRCLGEVSHSPRRALGGPESKEDFEKTFNEKVEQKKREKYQKTYGKGN